jgi:hypothetical protein
MYGSMEVQGQRHGVQLDFFACLALGVKYRRYARRLESDGTGKRLASLERGVLGILGRSPTPALDAVQAIAQNFG